MHTIDKRSQESAANLLKYSNRPSIGVILHGFSACDLGYQVSKNLNAYSEIDPYTEVCGFSMNRELPMLATKFAIFNSMDLNTYYGTVVATDIPTWQISLNAPSKHRFLYIYDIARLQNLPPDFSEKINASGVKIIARHKDHLNFLKKLGLKNILNETIQDFDIAKFMELTR